MTGLVRTFWQIRLQETKERLEANNFATFVAGATDMAIKRVMREILPASGARALSYGD